MTTTQWVMSVSCFRWCSKKYTCFSQLWYEAKICKNLQKHINLHYPVKLPKNIWELEYHQPFLISHISNKVKLIQSHLSGFYLYACYSPTKSIPPSKINLLSSSSGETRYTYYQFYNAFSSSASFEFEQCWLIITVSYVICIGMYVHMCVLYERTQ